MQNLRWIFYFYCINMYPDYIIVEGGGDDGGGDDSDEESQNLLY